MTLYVEKCDSTDLNYFVVWKKALCCIQTENRITSFKRLEFLLLYDFEDVDLELEEIDVTLTDDGKPALILTCRTIDDNLR